MAKKKEIYKINHEIKAQRVKLIVENINVGEFNIIHAMKIAQEQGLDLVEISPNLEIPICKVVDYDKFLYEKKKKQKEQEKKNRENAQEMKELRFGPNINDHDFEYRCEHARNFINDNDKVKATILFKGREITFKEKGELILLKLTEKLEDVAVAENLPKLEGKRMYIVLRPKKKK